MKNLIPLPYEMLQFYWRLQSHEPFMVGFPGNLNNDFSEFSKFFNFIINNVGDPSCIDTPYKMHSKQYEIKILDFFKNLYGLNGNSWGYLTNGGTESNLMGLLMGRSKYPHATIYSTNGHYSVKKNAVVLNVPFVEIKTQNNGEMDYENLRYYLLRDTNPPIVNLTIGTTFDGAIDSIDKTLLILKETGHQSFYLHCDAALFGGFLPFLGTKHEVDFSKRIDSMSISAHKFFGIPFPSGIFLSKEKPHGSFINCVEYIDSDDTTISGSRNGQLAILLWGLIEYKGIETFCKEAILCVENAKYLREKLSEADFNPHLNEDSIVVTFDIPSDKVINRWQLATQGKKAHVVVMQHVSKETIDLLIKDIVSL